MLPQKNEWLVKLSQSEEVTLASFLDINVIEGAAHIVEALPSTLAPLPGPILTALDVKAPAAMNSISSISAGLTIGSWQAHPSLPALQEIAIDALCNLADSAPVVSGSLTAKISGASTPFPVKLTLPAQEKNTVSLNGSTGFSQINDLSPLLGNFQFSALLPGLDNCAVFEITKLKFHFENEFYDLVQIDLGLSVGDALKITGGVSTENTKINLTIKNPLSDAPQVTGTIQATVQVGATIIPLSISRTLTKWTIALKKGESATLPGLSEVAELFSFDISAHLPLGVDLTSIRFDAFSIVYDPDLTILQSIALDASLPNPWVLKSGVLEIQQLHILGAIAKIDAASEISGDLNAKVLLDGELFPIRLPLPLNIKLPDFNRTFGLDTFSPFGFNAPGFVLPSISLPSLAGVGGFDIGSLFGSLPGIGEFPPIELKGFDIDFDFLPLDAPQFRLPSIDFAFNFSGEGLSFELPQLPGLSIQECSFSIQNPLMDATLPGLPGFQELPIFDIFGSLNFCMTLPDGFKLPLELSFKLPEGKIFDANISLFDQLHWRLNLDMEALGRFPEFARPEFPDGGFIPFSVSRFQTFLPGLAELKLPDALLGLNNLEINLYELDISFPPGLSEIEKVRFDARLSQPWPIVTGIVEIVELRAMAEIVNVLVPNKTPSVSGGNLYAKLLLGTELFPVRLPLPFNAKLPDFNWTFGLDTISAFGLKAPGFVLPSLSLPALAGIGGFDVQALFAALPGIGGIGSLNLALEKFDLDFDWKNGFALHKVSLCFSFPTPPSIAPPGGFGATLHSVCLHIDNPLKNSKLGVFNVSGFIRGGLTLANPPEPFTFPFKISFQNILSESPLVEPLFDHLKWSLELDTEQISIPGGFDDSLPRYKTISSALFLALIPGVENLSLPPVLTGITDLTVDVYTFKIEFARRFEAIDQLTLDARLSKPWLLMPGHVEIRSMRVDATILHLAKTDMIPEPSGDLFADIYFAGVVFPIRLPLPVNGTDVDWTLLLNLPTGMGLPEGATLPQLPFANLIGFELFDLKTLCGGFPSFDLNLFRLLSPKISAFDFHFEFDPNENLVIPGLHFTLDYPTGQFSISLLDALEMEISSIDFNFCNFTFFDTGAPQFSMNGKVHASMNFTIDGQSIPLYFILSFSKREYSIEEVGVDGKINVLSEFRWSWSVEFDLPKMALGLPAGEPPSVNLSFPEAMKLVPPLCDLLHLPPSLQALVLEIYYAKLIFPGISFDRLSGFQLIAALDSWAIVPGKLEAQNLQLEVYASDMEIDPPLGPVISGFVKADLVAGSVSLPIKLPFPIDWASPELSGFAANFPWTLCLNPKLDIDGNLQFPSLSLARLAAFEWFDLRKLFGGFPGFTLTSFKPLVAEIKGLDFSFRFDADGDLEIPAAKFDLHFTPGSFSFPLLGAFDLKINRVLLHLRNLNFSGPDGLSFDLSGEVFAPIMITINGVEIEMPGIFGFQIIGGAWSWSFKLDTEKLALGFPEGEVPWFDANLAVLSGFIPGVTDLLKLPAHLVNHNLRLYRLDLSFGGPHGVTLQSCDLDLRLPHWKLSTGRFEFYNLHLDVLLTGLDLDAPTIDGFFKGDFKTGELSMPLRFELPFNGPDFDWTLHLNPELDVFGEIVYPEISLGSLDTFPWLDLGSLFGGFPGINFSTINALAPKLTKLNVLFDFDTTGRFRLPKFEIALDFNGLDFPFDLPGSTSFSVDLLELEVVNPFNARIAGYQFNFKGYFDGSLSLSGVDIDLRFPFEIPGGNFSAINLWNLNLRLPAGFNGLPGFSWFDLHAFLPNLGAISAKLSLPEFSIKSPFTLNALDFQFPSDFSGIDLIGFSLDINRFYSPLASCITLTQATLGMSIPFANGGIDTANLSGEIDGTFRIGDLSSKNSANYADLDVKISMPSKLPEDHGNWVIEFKEPVATTPDSVAETAFANTETQNASKLAAGSDLLQTTGGQNSATESSAPGTVSSLTFQGLCNGLKGCGSVDLNSLLPKGLLAITNMAEPFLVRLQTAASFGSLKESLAKIRLKGAWEITSGFSVTPNEVHLLLDHETSIAKIDFFGTVLAGETTLRVESVFNTGDEKWTVNILPPVGKTQVEIAEFSSLTNLLNNSSLNKALSAAALSASLTGFKVNFRSATLVLDTAGKLTSLDLDLDFSEATASISLPYFVPVDPSIVPEKLSVDLDLGTLDLSLDFSANTKAISISSDLSFSGLPDVMTTVTGDILPDDLTATFDYNLDASGVTTNTLTLDKSFDFTVPQLPIANSPESVDLKVKSFQIHWSDPVLSCDFDVKVPQSIAQDLGLNLPIKEWVPCRLSMDATNGAAIELLAWPFSTPRSEVKGDWTHIYVEEAAPSDSTSSTSSTGAPLLAEARFKLPKFSYNGTSFEARGAVELLKLNPFDFSIAPLKSFFTGTPLEFIANALPDQLPIFGALAENLASDMPKNVSVDLSPAVLLPGTNKAFIPDDLGDYLDFKIPTYYDFSIKTYPSGNLRFSLKTKQDEKISLIFALPGAVAFGVQFHGVALGDIGGHLTLDLEGAKIDIFNLALVQIFSMLGLNALPWRSDTLLKEIRFRIGVEKLFSLYEAGTPIPISLKDFRVEYRGYEGVAMGFKNDLTLCDTEDIFTLVSLVLGTASDFIAGNFSLNPETVEKLNTDFFLTENIDPARPDGEEHLFSVKALIFEAALSIGDIALPEKPKILAMLKALADADPQAVLRELAGRLNASAMVRVGPLKQTVNAEVVKFSEFKAGVDVPLTLQSWKSFNLSTDVAEADRVMISFQGPWSVPNLLNVTLKAGYLPSGIFHMGEVYSLHGDAGNGFITISLFGGRLLKAKLENNLPSAELAYWGDCLLKIAGVEILKGSAALNIDTATGKGTATLSGTVTPVNTPLIGVTANVTGELSESGLFFLEAAPTLTGLITLNVDGNLKVTNTSVSVGLTLSLADLSILRLAAQGTISFDSAGKVNLSATVTGSTGLLNLSGAGGELTVTGTNLAGLGETNHTPTIMVAGNFSMLNTPILKLGGSANVTASYVMNGATPQFTLGLSGALSSSDATGLLNLDKGLTLTAEHLVPGPGQTPKISVSGNFSIIDIALVRLAGNVTATLSGTSVSLSGSLSGGTGILNLGAASISCSNLLATNPEITLSAAFSLLDNPLIKIGGPSMKIAHENGALKLTGAISGAQGFVSLLGSGNPSISVTLSPTAPSIAINGGLSVGAGPLSISGAISGSIDKDLNLSLSANNITAKISDATFLTGSISVSQNEFSFTATDWLKGSGATVNSNFTILSSCSQNKYILSASGNFTFKGNINIKAFSDAIAELERLFPEADSITNTLANLPADITVGVNLTFDTVITGSLDVSLTLLNNALNLSIDLSTVDLSTCGGSIQALITSLPNLSTLIIETIATKAKNLSFDFKVEYTYERNLTTPDSWVLGNLFPGGLSVDLEGFAIKVGFATRAIFTCTAAQLQGAITIEADLSLPGWETQVSFTTDKNLITGKADLIHAVKKYIEDVADDEIFSYVLQGDWFNQIINASTFVVKYMQDTAQNPPRFTLTALGGLSLWASLDKMETPKNANSKAIDKENLIGSFDVELFGRTLLDGTISSQTPPPAVPVQFSREFHNDVAGRAEILRASATDLATLLKKDSVALKNALIDMISDTETDDQIKDMNYRLSDVLKQIETSKLVSILLGSSVDANNKNVDLSAIVQSDQATWADIVADDDAARKKAISTNASFWAGKVFEVKDNQTKFASMVAADRQGVADILASDKTYLAELIQAHPEPFARAIQERGGAFSSAILKYTKEFHAILSNDDMTAWSAFMDAGGRGLVEKAIEKNDNIPVPTPWLKGGIYHRMIFFQDKYWLLNRNRPFDVWNSNDGYGWKKVGEETYTLTTDEHGNIIFNLDVISTDSFAIYSNKIYKKVTHSHFMGSTTIEYLESSDGIKWGPLSGSKPLSWQEGKKRQHHGDILGLMLFIKAIDGCTPSAHCIDGYWCLKTKAPFTVYKSKQTASNWLGFGPVEFVSQGTVQNISGLTQIYDLISDDNKLYIKASINNSNDQIIYSSGDGRSWSKLTERWLWDEQRALQFNYTHDFSLTNVELENAYYHDNKLWVPVKNGYYDLSDSTFHDYTLDIAYLRIFKDLTYDWLSNIKQNLDQYSTALTGTPPAALQQSLTSSSALWADFLAAESNHTLLRNILEETPQWWDGPNNKMITEAWVDYFTSNQAKWKSLLTAKPSFLQRNLGSGFCQPILAKAENKATLATAVTNSLTEVVSALKSRPTDLQTTFKNQKDHWAQVLSAQIETLIYYDPYIAALILQRSKENYRTALTKDLTLMKGILNPAPLSELPVTREELVELYKQAIERNIRLTVGMLDASISLANSEKTLAMVNFYSHDSIREIELHKNILSIESSLIRPNNSDVLIELLRDALFRSNIMLKTIRDPAWPTTLIERAKSLIDFYQESIYRDIELLQNVINPASIMNISDSSDELIHLYEQSFENDMRMIDYLRNTPQPLLLSEISAALIDFELSDGGDGLYTRTDEQKGQEGDFIKPTRAHIDTAGGESIAHIDNIKHVDVGARMTPDTDKKFTLSGHLKSGLPLNLGGLEMTGSIEHGGLLSLTATLGSGVFQNATVEVAVDLRNAPTGNVHTGLEIRLFFLNLYYLKLQLQQDGTHLALTGDTKFSHYIRGLGLNLTLPLVFDGKERFRLTFDLDLDADLAGAEAELDFKISTAPSIALGINATFTILGVTKDLLNPPFVLNTIPTSIGDLRNEIETQVIDRAKGWITEFVSQNPLTLLFAALDAINTAAAQVFELKLGDSSLTRLDLSKTLLSQLLGEFSFHIFGQEMFKGSLKYRESYFQIRASVMSFDQNGVSLSGRLNNGLLYTNGDFSIDGNISLGLSYLSGFEFEDAMLYLSKSGTGAAKKLEARIEGKWLNRPASIAFDTSGIHFSSGFYLTPIVPLPAFSISYDGFTGYGGPPIRLDFGPFDLRSRLSIDVSFDLGIGNTQCDIDVELSIFEVPKSFSMTIAIPTDFNSLRNSIVDKLLAKAEEWIRDLFLQDPLALIRQAVQTMNNAAANIIKVEFAHGSVALMDMTKSPVDMLVGDFHLDVFNSRLLTGVIRRKEGNTFDISGTSIVYSVGGVTIAGNMERALLNPNGSFTLTGAVTVSLDFYNFSYSAARATISNNSLIINGQWLGQNLRLKFENSAIDALVNFNFYLGQSIPGFNISFNLKDIHSSMPDRNYKINLVPLPINAGIDIKVEFYLDRSNTIATFTISLTILFLTHNFSVTLAIPTDAAKMVSDLIKEVKNEGIRLLKEVLSTDPFALIRQAVEGTSAMTANLWEVKIGNANITSFNLTKGPLEQLTGALTIRVLSQNFITGSVINRNGVYLLSGQVNYSKLGISITGAASGSLDINSGRPSLGSRVTLKYQNFTIAGATVRFDNNGIAFGTSIAGQSLVLTLTSDGKLRGSVTIGVDISFGLRNYFKALSFIPRADVKLEFTIGSSFSIKVSGSFTFSSLNIEIGIGGFGPITASPNDLASLAHDLPKMLSDYVQNNLASLCDLPKISIPHCNGHLPHINWHADVDARFSHADAHGNVRVHVNSPHINGIAIPPYPDHLRRYL